MNLDYERINSFVDNGPGNYVPAEIALRSDLAGMRIYDHPVIKIGAADDPIFEEFARKPEVNLPYFVKPGQWLSGAESVISFFLPFTDRIKESNKPFEVETSPEWLHGRIEGQAFLFELCREIKKMLEEAGEQAVIPSLDPKFWAVEYPGTSPKAPDDKLGYTSAWSERHVAYVCGLGTFCLSKSMITEKGCCGRFGSIVTTAKLPVTPRPYTGIYEYCTMCGACVSHCPVQAISPEKGKNHVTCMRFVDSTKVKYAPRYGCGKCQVQVPCMSGIPVRKK